MAEYDDALKYYYYITLLLSMQIMIVLWFYVTDTLQLVQVRDLFGVADVKKIPGMGWGWGVGDWCPVIVKYRRPYRMVAVVTDSTLCIVAAI